MSASSTPAPPSKSPGNTHNPALPALQWANGTVWEILIEPAQKLYAFSVQLEPDHDTATFRIADPHTGAPLPVVDAQSLVYDVMKEACLGNRQVQVGYRDFGPSSQADIGRNFVIDRVTLLRTLSPG